MNTIKPITTGFFQVFFVAINTVFIQAGYTVGILAISFLISLIWTINVRQAMKDWNTRLLYCLGASVGSLSGWWISNFFLAWFR